MRCTELNFVRPNDRFILASRALEVPLLFQDDGQVALRHQDVGMLGAAQGLFNPNNLLVELDCGL